MTFWSSSDGPRHFESSIGSDGVTSPFWAGLTSMPTFVYAMLWARFYVFPGCNTCGISARAHGAGRTAFIIMATARNSPHVIRRPRAPAWQRSLPRESSQAANRPGFSSLPVGGLPSHHHFRSPIAGSYQRRWVQSSPGLAAHGNGLPSRSSQSDHTGEAQPAGLKRCIQLPLAYAGI